MWAANNYSEEMSTGRELLEELRRDEELRRALAEELLPEALRHKELRRTILLAVSREMATKEDLDKLGREIKAYIDARIGDVNARIEDLNTGINGRINDLNPRIEDLNRRISDLQTRINDLQTTLNSRIDDVNKRVGDLYGVVKASLVAIVVTLASTILVPLILKILF
jgi:chromosome segregation ATPase